MKGGVTIYRIVKKEIIGQGVTRIEVEAPEIARKVRAGQFVIVRADAFGERIPLTVADRDVQNGTISLIFQEVGRSTALLGSLGEGEGILDVVGPLGEPTPLEGHAKVAVVGGGVGCAIAYPQAKALHEMGASVDVIAGFRNRDLVILEEEMRAVADGYYLCSDDGTVGQKGLVTDVLRGRIEAGAGYDLVVAIGPVPMMKFVSLLTKEFGIKTIVSLNPIMIDGTGMCGCCRVRVGGEVKFACVDGPDFDGHLVDFDDLQRRNGFYREIEQCDAHTCRLTGEVRHG